jgi:hypothetical protein
MAEIAADYVPKTAPSAGRLSFQAGETIYAGALVCIAAGSGLLTLCGVAVTDFFVGIALNGGVSGDDIRVDISGVFLREVTVASAVQTSVMKPVWPANGNPEDIVLTDPAGILAIGFVSRFHSAGIADVKLFTPAEHLAQPS